MKAALTTPNNKCPQVIFALNRTASVTGRTKTLIISTTLTTGAKALGIPVVTNRVPHPTGFDLNATKTLITHSGSAKDNEKIKCLDNLNAQGISPDKFTHSRKKKTETNSHAAPAIAWT